MYKKASLLILSFILTAAVSYAEVTENAEVLNSRAREYYSLGKIYKEHGLMDYASREFEKAYDLIFMGNRIAAASDSESADAMFNAYEKNGSREGLYVVGSGDMLHVGVWENPDLTKDIIVRPDGRVSYPLIGEFNAAGLTIPEVDHLLTTRLKEFLRYPDVSVTLKSMGGRRVLVLGEVKGPGIQTLKDSGTVLEAIALAGGETKNAVLKSVLVIKGGLANPVPYRVNLLRFLKRPNTDDNMVLDAEDIVYVPEKMLSDITYTMRLILSPLAEGRIAHGDVKFYEDIK